jgi:Uma2 family endonuclease
MATVEAEAESEAGAEIGFRPIRITVDRFERMVAAGIFGEDEPVFLWEGSVVERMPKGRPHSRVVWKLQKALDLLMPDGYHVEPEQPMALGEASLPEPDLMAVRGSVDDYPDRAPRADAVALIVEVADSSVANDTRIKMAGYAAAGVPVYWVVDIPARRFVVFADPTGPAEVPTYRSRTEFGPDESVPVVLDGREVGRVVVRDFLPGA